jgi:FtsH-binding integral membrane protein
MGFIRKVYAIVLAQLAYTGASSAWLAHHPDLVQTLATPLWLGLAMFAFFSSSWALVLVEKWRRTAPTNIILLVLLTVGYSLPVSLVAATIPTSILFPSIMQTLLATAAVTAFCLRPDAKHDVSTLRHPLVAASLVHLAMLLVGQFVWAPDFWQNLKATFSLMLFSAYLMHDTASVVGTVDAEGLLDKRDYVYGAVRIYTDMMAMFVQILKLMSSRSEKRS